MNIIHTIILKLKFLYEPWLQHTDYVKFMSRNIKIVLSKLERYDIL